MRAAAAVRAGWRGLRPIRTHFPTVELIVGAAVVLTALAFYFRVPLTHLEQTLGPQDEGKAYYAYYYGDQSNGGTSVAAAETGRVLAWTCDLTRTYEYGYCGFGLIFDQTAGGSLDLSRFDRMKIVLHYEGPGDSLRVVLKNKDPRYLALGAPSGEKVNQASLPIGPGTKEIEVALDQLAVAEWWRDAASRASLELARPEYQHVSSLEILTGSESEPGRYTIRIEAIEFHGTSIGVEAWYSGIALAWLLIIGSIMLHRRRETARWRTQLLDSMRTTVDTIPHMVWSLDRNGTTHFNRRWTDFCGIPPSASDAFGLHRLLHRDDRRAAHEQWKRCLGSGDEFDVRFRIRHRSGEHRWVRARGVPLRDKDGAVAGWYGTCTDVHEAVLAQQALHSSIENERRQSRQLKWTSDHDVLTRLPNRRAFEARLAGMILNSQQRNSELGLLLIDMDYFKHVNDTLGHGAGDELLKTVAARLKKSVRRQDFVARIGGDEFAVILPDLKAESGLARVGEVVAAAAQVPLNIGERVVRPGVSIGGAIYPRDAANADELLKQADAALYTLKRAGRGGFRPFQNYMLDDVRTAAYQLDRARDVIAEDSIVAVYQPKIAIAEGNVVGFEALLRYNGANGTLELPETLAEAFNDYELAAKIGELMQRRVARDVRAWIDTGLPFGRVSINAAPAEFLRDDYAERLLRILDQYDVPPACIEIEVTEHAFVERGPECVARALDVLKASGVTISLDDFGTGYSSLSHIRDFPVDAIKVDRSYTKQIAEDSGTAALVAGMIHLASSLDMEVVAEGVETRRQLELLRAMGCHFAQGHLIGFPVEGARIGEYTSGNGRIRFAA